MNLEDSAIVNFIHKFSAQEILGFTENIGFIVTAVEPTNLPQSGGAVAG
jgi:hypothetical protein